LLKSISVSGTFCIFCTNIGGGIILATVSSFTLLSITFVSTDDSAVLTTKFEVTFDNFLLYSPNASLNACVITFVSFDFPIFFPTVIYVGINSLIFPLSCPDNVSIYPFIFGPS